MRSPLAAAALALVAPVVAGAGEADVLGVRVTQGADGAYTLAVTLRHADEGWDHYADRFEVLDPEGAVLATRVLRHPHVDEQPFTRTLEAVVVPAGLSQVRVRAGDSVHGFGGEEIVVTLPDRD